MMNLSIFHFNLRTLLICFSLVISLGALAAEDYPSAGGTGTGFGAFSGAAGLGVAPRPAGTADRAAPGSESDVEALKKLEAERAAKPGEERKEAPEPPRPTPKPEPLSLFQTFIKQTTGKVLPIYGAELFNRPNAFSDPQSAPVPSEYIVGPGDELLLKVYGSTMDMDQRLRVDRQGQIVLPKIGPISVAGIKVEDLEKHLKSKLSRVITNFKVFVTMGKLRGIEVYVVGQAKRPGKYVVSSLSSVINALFASGGPNSSGSLRNIQLIRDSKLVTTVDLYDFLGKGDTSKDRRLLAGDVINIAPAGPMVAFTGAIPSPGIFELAAKPAETSINELLPLAGGLSVQTSGTKVSFERVEADKTKPLVVQTLTLNEAGLKTALRDGDILTFFPMKPAFENAVTLKIMQADPVRVAIGPETRVKDVLPSKDILLTNEYYLRRFHPANLTRDQRDPRDSRTAQVDHEIKDARAESKDTKFPESRAVRSMQASKEDKEKKQIRQYEEFITRPGNQSEGTKVTLRNELDQINWEQAVIERQDPDNFTTQLISFNLGKAILEGDPQNNIQLQPGDTILVFSHQDVKLPVERLTRIVKLQGEVKAPGLYQLQPNETVTGLIARAGGLTANAYIFGTEVTRKSVKARQADNLQRAIRQLESQLRSNMARSITGVTDSAELGKLTAISERNAQLAQNQINRLQELEPNGRISLEIDPTEPALPAFPLEDGDEINIPVAPGYVSAVGAVYNDNVLIYKQGRRVKDYLNVAGVSESAERDNTFVLRADGSIVTASERNVERLELYPGDTIVVPEKYYEESGYAVFMRGLKDWTQVLFQLGLSAAAIHTLNK